MQEDVPLSEATEFLAEKLSQHRFAELLSQIGSGMVTRIIEGPVEDVPTYIRNVWLVGINDGLFYLTASISGEGTPDSIRRELIGKIQGLPSADVGRLKVMGSLTAHQLTRREVCCALWTGQRKADNIRITAVSHSPILSLEEASFLLKRTVQRSIAKNN